MSCAGCHSPARFNRKAVTSARCPPALSPAQSYTLFINAESFGVLPDDFCTSLRIIMGGGEKYVPVPAEHWTAITRHCP